MAASQLDANREGVQGLVAVGRWLVQTTAVPIRGRPEQLGGAKTSPHGNKFKEDHPWGVNFVLLGW
jgi:hypothetical protein